ncbi:sugar phosphate nucleotidyltransferase [Paenibacillus sp. IHBB 10380]|uniref:sugar phosphate nucleotidyltransferase n=1 Tax=Paenibacillus sp. IHBB 10380 TaxID=1566358 RepID=UPI0005CFE957|nr:sugar phosphate nucleotidyltransferase [Paenibacillus sp. IHBB 10380]AJS57454.1 spore coat protein [Paenibacillus sp. IHBB 10380]
MKGVILAGGTGTRLYPLTQLINKHLLPIGKYPMICYGIERLRQAGITDILIVMGKHSSGLYTDFLGSGKEWGVQLTYRIQEAAGGIAEALELTQNYMSIGERFVVLLGDNLFINDLRPYVDRYLMQPEGSAKVLLKQVNDAHRYGVPVFDQYDPTRIVFIEEKPVNPKSDYCVTGIYMYDTEVFSKISQIQASARGEFEITDVNNLYAGSGQLEYDTLTEWWIDAGTFDSLQEADRQMKGFLP